MAKIYKENQRYHDLFSILLFSIVLGLLAYKIFMQFFVLELGMPVMAISFLVLAILSAVAFYKSLKLKIRISSKKLSIKIDPIPWTGLKINKEEVDSLYFFKVSEVELCAGWALDFGHRTRIFNFGDKEGVILKKKNGKQVIIFSKKLYRERAEIKSLMTQKKWSLPIYDEN
jgi:hypothetical protein